MDAETPSFRTLGFEVADGVARLTLDRPDAANAFTTETCREMLEAFIACDHRDDVRAVLLTGAGRMFTAGGDLKFFAAQGDRLGGALKEITTYLHAAVSRMAHMDPPVVCAVNGMAAGAGVSLVAACDYVVAAADAARFTLAYTAGGLSPDGSSTWFLPRLVGLRRARELILTNRVLAAAEAQEIGLVDRVVPDADLAGEAARQAASFAAGPTKAYGAAKRLLLDGMIGGLETQMDREARSISDLARTADLREGVAAFVAKRKPDFRGE